MTPLWIAMILLFWAVPTEGAVVGATVDYKQGDTLLEGYLAYDDASQAVRPGVLLVHEWYGLNDYARMRAEQLAQMGYVAFALDMYGKGVRAADNREAAALAGKLKGDRALMRARASAGLDVLKRHSLVDPRRVAAIGYCFGGTAVLELARAGAEVMGVVSFHGGLDTPHPEATPPLRTKFLVLHGADDPLVSQAEIAAFQAEMRRAGADWQMIYYGGAVHSFTNPKAGVDPKGGVAYHEPSERRSWRAMKLFFDEIFQ